MEATDDTIIAGAEREGREELHIVVTDPRLLAVVQGRRSDGTPRTMLIAAGTLSAPPRSTDEMHSPKLFAPDEMPYDLMHPETLYWLPKVLDHADDEPLSLAIDYCPNGKPIGSRPVPMPELPRPIH